MNRHYLLAQQVHLRMKVSFPLIPSGYSGIEAPSEAAGVWSYCLLEDAMDEVVMVATGFGYHGTMVLTNTTRFGDS